MSCVIVLSDSDEAASSSSLSSSSDDQKENKRSEANEFDFGSACDFDFPEVPFCRETAEVARSERANLAKLSASNEREDSGDDRVAGGRNAGNSQRATKAVAREERRQALAREKALRAVERKRSRDARPGECMRFMVVELDSGIDAFAFHAEIKSTLLGVGVRFDVTAQLVPNSITWRRDIEESYVGEDNEVRVSRSARAEEHAIVIWSSRQTADHVAEGTLSAAAQNIRDLLPGHTVTLVIFGMEEYFAYRKKRKSGSRRDDGQFGQFPVISRQQLEMCLTEIQLSLNCNSRSIESAQDLALMVYQYTKSISEIPYKAKRHSQESKFDWYVTGDSKNTVRVDKSGNGLKRLWQQQLCQFNLCGLETAEAICAAYPSPAQLFKAYRNCTPEEGINLLKDIPIRRAAGPLTAVRKVGPELSKKIYVMFTSENGDDLLE